MSAVLKELGITKDELRERLITKLADELMGRGDHEDGYPTEATFLKAMKKAVCERTDRTITDLAEKHVLPNVEKYIETLTLQETNKWGERNGKKLTFIEFLVSRCEAYMTEKVNYEGEAKSEANGYSWNGTQTRVAHMIDKHLHFAIETATKQALATANSTIAAGLLETVKLKLQEAIATVKIQVK